MFKARGDGGKRYHAGARAPKNRRECQGRGEVYGRMPSPGPIGALCHARNPRSAWKRGTYTTT